MHSTAKGRRFSPLKSLIKHILSENTTKHKLAKEYSVLRFIVSMESIKIAQTVAILETHK